MVRERWPDAEATVGCQDDHRLDAVATTAADTLAAVFIHIGPSSTTSRNWRSTTSASRRKLVVAHRDLARAAGPPLGA
jgi:hypothetical protein